MKFGYLSVNSANGIHPGPLAAALEQRGFESLWVPEHSHIPINSVDLYPGGPVLPDGYAHAMSPFISLMAAAANSTYLTLGTGVSLPLEHDLLDLACMTGTLDTLSDGRLILGAGVGWNSEELANHHPELNFKQRYSALRERIHALRAAWSGETSDYQGRFDGFTWGSQISHFHGERDTFTDSWVFPKPVNGSVPVALGMTGPLGVQHALDYADMWLPVDIALLREGEMDVTGRIKEFCQALIETGRPANAVPITLFVWGDESPGTLERYMKLGIERLVFSPPAFDTHSSDVTLRRLDELTERLQTLGASL